MKTKTKQSLMLTYLISMIVGCLTIIGIIAYKVGFTSIGVALIISFTVIGLLVGNILRLWLRFEYDEEEVIYKTITFYKSSESKYRAYDSSVWHDNIISAYQHYIFTHMEELTNTSI